MSEAEDVIREIEKVVDQHRTFLSQKADDSRLDVLEKSEATFVEEQNLMADITALLESRAEGAHGDDFRNDTPLASLHMRSTLMATAWTNLERFRPSASHQNLLLPTHLGGST